MKYPTDYKYNVLAVRQNGCLVSEFSIGQVDTTKDLIKLIRQDKTSRINAYGYREYTIVNQQDNTVRVITKKA